MRLMFIIILLTGIFTQLSAQDLVTPRNKIGIKAGVNYSFMNFNRGYLASDPAIVNSWKPGLYVGALIQVPLNRYITLQTEYAFTWMRSEDVRIKTAYNLSYLTLPLLLKLAVSQRIAVIAGPQFDLLVGANKKNSGTVTSITHDTEERNISGVVAIEVNLVKSVFVDARYIHGFNHIGIGQRSSITEFKWQGVVIAAGVRF